MTLVVPFDGSELAEAALVRAAEFATVFEENVRAVSVIPENNARYAREQGWLGPEEEFDLESVVGDLHTNVTDLYPSADFQHVVVDRYAPTGEIANRIRKLARDAGASMVFVGSENAGHVVASVSSVGKRVLREDAYDVVIIRQRMPSKVAALREHSPHREEKSDFYLP